MQRSSVDRFMKESCKSFRDVSVKNSARRNSLLKKTLGIETERKLASARMDREEKLLRDQLKLMKLEKTKTTIINHVKVAEEEVAQKETLVNVKHIPSEDVNPYPVTFCTRTPSPRRRKISYEEKARMLTSRRGRRVSKEFEDLQLNTQTGKLAPPRSHLSVLNSPGLRRRLEHGSRSSMSSSEELSSSTSHTQTRLSRKQRQDYLK